MRIHLSIDDVFYIIYVFIVSGHGKVNDYLRDSCRSWFLQPTHGVATPDGRRQLKKG